MNIEEYKRRYELYQDFMYKGRKKGLTDIELDDLIEFYEFSMEVAKIIGYPSAGICDREELRYFKQMKSNRESYGRKD